jgi:hypothetical protein
VPKGFDIDVYVVLEDYGQIGRAYREVDEETGQLNRESWQSFDPAVCSPPFDKNVLTFDISKLAQSLSKGVKNRLRFRR